MTELKDKAIDIKGKAYVLVSDRIIYFNENYPNGSIVTERFKEWDMEIFKATVTPDVNIPTRCFTWYSQAKWWEGFINKTSAMENAETSAVWRALAMMGIWVLDSVASADEMAKAWAIPSDTIQKEVSNADKPNAEEKPWFNKPELDKFTSFATQYKTADEALNVIKNKYRIGKEKEAEVRKLYESLKVINDTKKA